MAKLSCSIFAKDADSSYSTLKMRSATRVKWLLSLATVGWVIGNTLGCAGARPQKDQCSSLTPPASLEIHVWLTNDFSAPEEVVPPLENSIAAELLHLNRKVKLVKNRAGVPDDGLLLKVDLIRAFRSGLSKQIDVDYHLINNATNQALLDDREELASKFGYGKIILAIGNTVAYKVNRVLMCFD